MLAEVELKCWPIFCVFWGPLHGQHFNSTVAWFCREERGGDKKPKLGQHLTQIKNIHIYIYIFGLIIYIYIYIYIYIDMRL